MKFLEQENHRVRVVFTPKHCSWLNPIELVGLGTLQKGRLNNTSFSSVQGLESKLKDYIVFANEFLCKPYKWNFIGFVKNKKIDA